MNKKVAAVVTSSKMISKVIQRQLIYYNSERSVIDLGS